MWPKALLLSTLVVFAFAQDVPSECKENPPKDIQMKCCPQPKLWKIEDYPNCEHGKPCMGDCVFKEAKCLKSDNKLDFDAIRAFAADRLAKMTPAWSDIMDKGLKSCQNVENEDDKANPNKCLTFADKYFMCLMRYKLHNCPADVWNNSDPDCTALKDKVAKCRKP